MAAVACLASLADLSLDASRQLGDRAIVHLRSSYALRRLDVTRCAFISFLETVKTLAHIPDLVVVKRA